MQDDEKTEIYTIGTLLEKDDSTIEWTLRNVRKFFEWQKQNILRSPKFQIRNVTWDIDLYFKYRYGTCLYFSVRRLHYNIRPRSVISCHVVAKRDGRILGENMQNLSVDDTVVSASIADSDDFKASYKSNSGDVTVLCTFYEEVEAGTAPETSKEDPIDHGKHLTEKAEGLDILSSHMKNLFLNQQNCDYIIRVKDKLFLVHKAILFARSPVLAGMLQEDTAEDDDNLAEIEIADCESDIFEKFILYLYTGRVEELSWENALPLYILGDKYDMEHLRKECAAQYMGGNLCVQSFCNAFRLGLRQNSTPLVKNAEKFFLENAAEILVTPDWQLLMKEHPDTCNELFIQYVGKNNKK